MSSSDSLSTEAPELHPPPGPTYVLVQPIELSFRFFVANVVIAFFLLVSLGLRVFSRFYIALKLGWDDALTFLASIFCFGQMALFGLLVFGGLGHHIDTVPAPNQFSIPKVLFSFELFHILALNIAKLSALCLYLKLFNSRTVVKYTNYCIIGILFGTMGLILWQFLFCHPLYKMWEWNGLETCGDRKPLYVAVCVWSIFTDLLVLSLPLPTIWGLKMDRVRKIRLSALFATGLIVTATSFIRLGYIFTINYHDDFSFHSVPATFLAVLEPPETIISVSLPMIYSLYTRVRASQKSRSGPKPPRLGVNPRPYRSSFGRINTTGHNFTELEATVPDPFEMTDMDNSQRQVAVSADKKGKSAWTLRTGTTSVDSSSGPNAVNEEPPPNPNPQSNGIMVSTDFTVSVSHRQ
ncbi:hypothetical protein F4861DRAFT_91649 [Xylaria intraflava]|nr:hypothetical protein F4861DRAFT_91649 [Xylaria intraflava]